MCVCVGGGGYTCVCVGGMHVCVCVCECVCMGVCVWVCGMTDQSVVMTATDHM